MIAEMKRITIAIPHAQREALLQFLQEEEMVHIMESQEIEAGSAQASSENTQNLLAQLQYTIDFIARIEKELGIVQRKQLKNIFAGKPTATLPELEHARKNLDVPALVARVEHMSDALTAADSRARELAHHIDLLKPWATLHYTNPTEPVSTPVIHRFLKFTLRNEHDLPPLLQSIPTAAWQEISSQTNRNIVCVFVELIAHTQDIEAVDALEQRPEVTRIHIPLEEGQSIAELFKKTQHEYAQETTAHKNLLQEASELLPLQQDIRFAYDALLHQLERERAQTHITSYTFSNLVIGWTPTMWLPTLTKKLEQHFPEAALEAADVDPTQKIPVLFQNNKLVRPFEAVTDLYGKPAYHELDPSGPLALFFLVGFGLALTDAGYGIIMMIATFLAERFLKLKQDMQKLVRVLFYAGAMTVILGGVTGGWFSITLETLPDGFMKSFLLGVKLLDPLKQPILLLSLIFGFGIIQLVYAWVVRGIYHWKQGNKAVAIMDDFSWVLMVTSILIWLASSYTPILSLYTPAFKLFMYAVTLFMVVTQGRASKNIFLRVGGGALSLYGLIAFVSDMLSYSRLLALGLATGIIGLVVNLIASMVHTSIPVVGIVLAGVVLVVGHVFNLGINVLGAYIHSGRLQFVEFFPKFLEGGGLPFRPFGRVGKYVDNPKDYIKVL